MLPKIYIVGYGNPGRQDDALGIRLAEKVHDWSLSNGIECIETDTNYQLNIEDADNISDKDLVIFADASKENIENCVFTEIQPNPKVEFTMHHVSPSFILHLCREIYDNYPHSYLMHIKGYEWEFMGEMTKKAHENLDKAFEHLKKFIIAYLSKQNIKPYNRKKIVLPHKN